MIAVLCATVEEANPLLVLTGAVEQEKEQGNCRVFSGKVEGKSLLIGVSGMGTSAARQTCHELVQDFDADTVVNLGVCGALTGKLKAGDIIGVNQALSEDHISASGSLAVDPIRLQPWPHLSSAALGTVSSPVFDSRRQKTLATHCELVDMEGWAIADECRILAASCRMLKGVSDQADAKGRADLQTNLQPVSQKLAERFVEDFGLIQL